MLVTGLGKMAELIDVNPGAELTYGIEAVLVAFNGIDIAGGV